MSSTSRPTASEIREPGGVQQLQQRPVAQRQRAVGRAVAARAVQQCQHLVDGQALGQPAARRRRPDRPRHVDFGQPFGGGEPVQAAHRDQRPRRRHRRQRHGRRCRDRRARSATRNSLTSFSLTLARSSMPRASGARSSGAGRADRSSTCWPRRRARSSGGRGSPAAVSSSADRTSSYASRPSARRTPSACPATARPPGAAGDAVRHRVGGQNPGDRNGIDDLAAEHHAHAPRRADTTAASCRLPRRGPRAGRPRSTRSPGTPGPIRR